MTQMRFDTVANNLSIVAQLFDNFIFPRKGLDHITNNYLNNGQMKTKREREKERERHRDLPFINNSMYLEPCWLDPCLQQGHLLLLQFLVDMGGGRSSLVPPLDVVGQLCVWLLVHVVLTSVRPQGDRLKHIQL